MGPFTNLESTGSDGSQTAYVSSWYDSGAYFVYSSNPWIRRSGAYYNGVLASQFYFNKGTGATFGHVGFRLVLTLQQ